MKKRKKKSNKQSRREIIADVKRREVEWRKERRKEKIRFSAGEQRAKKYMYLRRAIYDCTTLL